VLYEEKGRHCLSIDRLRKHFIFTAVRTNPSNINPSYFLASSKENFHIIFVGTTNESQLKACQWRRGFEVIIYLIIFYFPYRELSIDKSHNIQSNSVHASVFRHSVFLTSQSYVFPSLM
jgi:hypothetical protein